MSMQIILHWPGYISNNSSCKHAQLLIHVRLFVTPWTVAQQAPLSMGFPRQEYWSGLPFPLPGDLADSGIKSTCPGSLALPGRFFKTETPGGLIISLLFSSVQFSSVSQSCLTLCNPMDCSTPGYPVHHQLLEFTQTHAH